MRILSSDIKSDDGVANAAIAEAAQRLEEQKDRIKRLEEALNTLVKMHRSFIGKDDGITHERSYYCFYKGQYDHWKKAIDVLEAKEAKP
jgi:chromosome segregation ATPase